MTQDQSDKILELTQELFQQDEGVKRLLEALIERAMWAELSDGASRTAARTRSFLTAPYCRFAVGGSLAGSEMIFATSSAFPVNEISIRSSRRRTRRQ